MVYRKGELSKAIMERQAVAASGGPARIIKRALPAFPGGNAAFGVEVQEEIVPAPTSQSRSAMAAALLIDECEMKIRDTQNAPPAENPVYWQFTGSRQSCHRVWDIEPHPKMIATGS